MNEKHITCELIQFLLEKKWSFAFSNYYMLGWESDVIAMTPANMLYEFEVKTSRADFKADFKKPKHQQIAELDGSIMLPNRFCYVCPDKLISKDEIPKYSGLYYVHDNNKTLAFEEIKKAPKIHNYDFSQEPDFYKGLMRNLSARELKYKLKIYRKGNCSDT